MAEQLASTGRYADGLVAAMASPLRMVPSRGVKRLLYWCCVWTVLCYGLFQLSTHENTVTYITNHVQRGLLEKLTPTEAATEKPSANAFDLQPQVDKSPALSDQDLLARMANYSNLPLEYWGKHKMPKSSDSCVKYPSLYELDFNNIYWQRLQTSNGTFYLYGAYFDDRWRGGSTPYVRILSMVDRVKPPPTACQFWFTEGKSPVFGQASYTYGWISKWGNYKDGILQPYLVSCKVPKKEAAGRIPSSVSLVEKPCDKPTTNLRVTNYRPAKRDFAVCVKGLDFLQDDLSVRLVEWLELINIVGAEKVFLYELEVHPNISKVLKYYQEKGLVELTPITLPGNQPNLPGFRHLYLKSKLTNKRQNEVIPYNDCLYRNLYAYKYVVLLDIDEVIMPVRYLHWRELMDVVEKQALAVKNYSRASYNVRNVYFLDDLLDGEELTHTSHEQGIPSYLHMLQHVYRSGNFTKPGAYVKCFHNTERAVWLHNHFPLSCFGTCTTWSVGTDLAQMQHYRKDCVGPLRKNCTKEYRSFTVRDTTIWKYKDELIRRTTDALSKLGFFRDR